jgi:hypothetical protein
MRVMFDEVFGFLPPHPANPPAKRPLLALMKQARAFGVGIVIATQNPMDLDFLWDSETTLAEYKSALVDPDPGVRAHYVGRLMRQARPDYAFQFVRPRVIREPWPLLFRYLGTKREFWTWIFDQWEQQGLVWR